MVTAYEAIFIVDSTLAEDQVTSIVNKYTDVIKRGNGEIDDIDRWETRRLAYDVKGRREGNYVVVNFRSEPAAKNELDRIFRISDDAIRHIIVKVSEKADRFPSKTRSAEQERREREMAARAPINPPAAPAAEQPVTELAPAAAPAAAESAPAEAPEATGSAAEAPAPEATPVAAADDATAEASESPAASTEETEEANAES
jgi:small subunit ribosomal protein S6